MGASLDHSGDRDHSRGASDRHCRRRKVTSLLIVSQVVLSFQLPFAVIPLIQFTGNRAKMGEFVNSRLTSIIGWTVAVIILFLNFEYVWLILRA